jgi:hypothetical protein
LRSSPNLAARSDANFGFAALGVSLTMPRGAVMMLPRHKLLTRLGFAHIMTLVDIM